ncbi:MAG: outer membrane protein assembly factor BamA, partial [Gammaproteobacteria bacterium]|nr:outer membrane protein assembly factor BamA [Gammaproteobacteria bacterium]
MLRKFLRSLFIGLILVHGQANAFNAFTVKDIKVEGLQRISLGTVLTYFPTRVRDKVSSGSEIGDAIRSLYATGFFYDVKISRDNG